MESSASVSRQICAWPAVFREGSFTVKNASMQILRLLRDRAHVHGKRYTVILDLSHIINAYIREISIS